MKLFAIGGSKPYSVAPATDTMLPTVIVEIKGTDPNPAIAGSASSTAPTCRSRAPGTTPPASPACSRWCAP